MSRPKVYSGTTVYSYAAMAKRKRNISTLLAAVTKAIGEGRDVNVKWPTTSGQHSFNNVIDKPKFLKELLDNPFGRNTPRPPYTRYDKDYMVPDIADNNRNTPLKIFFSRVPAHRRRFIRTPDDIRNLCEDEPKRTFEEPDEWSVWPEPQAPVTADPDGLTFKQLSDDVRDKLYEYYIQDHDQYGYQDDDFENVRQIIEDMLEDMPIRASVEFGGYYWGYEWTTKVKTDWEHEEGYGNLRDMSSRRLRKFLINTLGHRLYVGGETYLDDVIYFPFRQFVLGQHKGNPDIEDLFSQACKYASSYLEAEITYSRSKLAMWEREVDMPDTYRYFVDGEEWDADEHWTLLQSMLDGELYRCPETMELNLRCCEAA